MNQYESEAIIANETALLESIKVIVNLADGKAETINEGIDKLIEALKKGQRSNR